MVNINDVYSDFDLHLMQDEKPSVYFNELFKTDVLNEVYPFTLLKALINVNQSAKHHPEGTVWNHTMLVVNEAAHRKQQSENPRVLMWAALLHDLGKATTTVIRKDKITSYDHDIAGEILATNFLNVFIENVDFITKVAKMVRWHMQILYVTKGLPYAKVTQMKNDVSIDEIALLSLCDRLGRGKMSNERIDEAFASVKTFTKICKAYKY